MGETGLKSFHLFLPSEKNGEKMNNEKQIGDMYLAAALLAYGAKLIRVDKSDTKHQKFIFAEATIPRVYTISDITILAIVNPTLAQIESSFISKELMFPPTYPDTVRNIKSLIHSA